MKNALILMMVTCAICVAGSAEAKAKKTARTFTSMDKDSDGTVSKAEFVTAEKAAGKKAQSKAFKKADINKDGLLDTTEYTKYPY